MCCSGLKLGLSESSVLIYKNNASFIAKPYAPLTQEFLSKIRVIPQGTVDNNLGPDRLAGPKALDPNYCRQQTLWLHDLYLEVLTVHGNELHVFGGKAFAPTHTIYVVHLT